MHLRGQDQEGSGHEPDRREGLSRPVRHPARVAVTRPRSSADRLSTLLRERGFEPLHIPITRILPPEDAEPLGRAAGRIAEYDWIVVTSARAVPPLVEALERAGTARDGSRRVCAVGPRTAEALGRAGITVDLVPERFLAEGIVEALLAADRSGGASLAGARILLPRAEEGRDVIPRELEAVGARVDVVSAYRTEADPAEAARLVAAVEGGEVDVLTFTAGSAVRSFAEAWRAAAAGEERSSSGLRIAAIGPATAAVLEAEGLSADRVAEPHTLEGLADAVTMVAQKLSR